MYKSPYTRFKQQKLTLNDYLAIDRTVLANERTLLSYGRTALALAALGGTGMAYFAEWYLQAGGAVVIAVAATILWRGWTRYGLMQVRLSVALERMTGAPEDPLEEPMDAAAKKEE